MTPERMRALLEGLEWIEYSPDSDRWLACPVCCQSQEKGHWPDCELSAALAVSVAADLTPTPVRVATSSHSGDERQSLQNMQQLPAPHVKVTEVVGLLDVDDGIFPDGSDPRPYGLVSCCPDEAEDKRGRFRITVEFWPQED